MKLKRNYNFSFHSRPEITFYLTMVSFSSRGMTDQKAPKSLQGPIARDKMATPHNRGPWVSEPWRQPLKLSTKRTLSTRTLRRSLSSQQTWAFLPRQLGVSMYLTLVLHLTRSHRVDSAGDSCLVLRFLTKPKTWSRKLWTKSFNRISKEKSRTLKS